MQYHLFWVVLDVVALELDELVEAELAQRLSFTGVLPANPRKILSVLVSKYYRDLMTLTGAG